MVAKRKTVAKKKATKKGVRKVSKKSVKKAALKKGKAKRATVKKVKKTKTTAKKVVRAQVTPKALGRVAKVYTKSELYSVLVERTGLAKKEVGSVLDELVTIIKGHIVNSGPGKFVLPGILKMTVKRIPARKARKGINPFTGEPAIFKAKPASKKVKIMPLKNLKEMVV